MIKNFTALSAVALSIVFPNVSSANIVNPNIVYILADDLGIECLSSYGGTDHKTPHIDKLATQGMRFTDYFSNPYCSPSRANLLTGRYPFKNSLKEVTWNAKAHANTYLDAITPPSFARQLKDAGYATAIAGKWQLSFLHQRNQINRFGFDQYQCWQIFKDGGAKTTRFHEPYFNRNGKIIAKEIAEQYGPDVNVDFLIDFSDLFPTLCMLAGAPLPSEKIHGQSFHSQLLGKAAEPREWVHVQDKEQRHVRDKEYILNNRNQLRPVAELWNAPPETRFRETFRKRAGRPQEAIGSVR